MRLDEFVVAREGGLERENVVDARGGDGASEENGFPPEEEEESFWLAATDSGDVDDAFFWEGELAAT